MLHSNPVLHGLSITLLNATVALLMTSKHYGKLWLLCQTFFMSKHVRSRLPLPSNQPTISVGDQDTHAED